MTGGEVIQSLNRSGLSARLISGRVYISPANGVTSEIARLVMENRDALVQTLAKFGALNQVNPDLQGVSHQSWLRSLPISAFVEGNR